MASINTNISALNAQKSMIDQTNKSDQAVERLASGLRINSAADDAAGTAIASKMEAQVRSLGVAIRNGHDAISMTQTAEVALGEMENILQRVRELAVQAGNSTLSSQDRNAIQAEVTALTAEIDDIASSTNFNGVKLLDGTNSNVEFQVGVDASDSLSVNLQSSSSMDLGVGGSNGTGVYTSGRVFLGTIQNIETDAIKLNGQNALSAKYAATSVGTTNAAATIADGINLNTHVHGAVATAFNRVVGAEMGDEFRMTTTVVITAGDSGDITIAAQSSMEDLADEISTNVENVTARVGANNSLILENTNGHAIKIGAGGNEIGFVEAQFEGMYTLVNTDGSQVDVKLGNKRNGFEAESTATGEHMGFLGLNETQAGGVTKGFAVGTAALALTDDIRINGVQVGATVLKSAEAKVAAINAISDQTGVTATATTTALLDLDFKENFTSSSFEINDTAIAIAAAESIDDVITVINGLQIGIEASSFEGQLKLVSRVGADIEIGLPSVVAFVNGFKDGDGVSQTVADDMTARGTITLTSADGGVIKLTDGTATNTGLAKLGLEGQSELENAKSGGVNVTTVDGATAALGNIDKAIEKLSGFRASFGAVENRIDAKINNLTTLKVNTQAAQSRIEDADFASETTNMTKAQILSQAATSMLAQANASKQNLLALLQG